MPGSDGWAAVGFPSERHGVVLRTILEALDADDNVRGVLLGGSLARGSARPDSDVDVLVVIAEQREASSWRQADYGLATDFGVRTASGWESTFSPERPGDESWGYAFLDGIILRDPDRTVEALVARATDRHAAYRTPAPILEHYARLWSHVLPKMRAVLGHGDPTEIGWAATVMMDDVVRSVWAVNDRPNPSLDLGTFQRHLGELSVPAGIADRLHGLLRAGPAEKLQQQIALIDELRPLLSGSSGDRHPDAG